MKVTTDILTRDGRDIAFGDYSAAWRFHRKIVHGALCMFGEGSASIEKISEYTGLLWSHDAADSFTEESKRELKGQSSHYKNMLSSLFAFQHANAFGFIFL